MAEPETENGALLERDTYSTIKKGVGVVSRGHAPPGSFILKCQYIQKNLIISNKYRVAQ